MIGQESSGAAEYSMGEWRVIPALNRLHGPAGDRQLEPQTMRVLLALMSHGGEVLTRQRLHELAWDGALVSDESLSRAIFDLRKALGDRAGAPRYIETIRKVGYRLIVPVQEITPTAAAVSGDAAQAVDVDHDIGQAVEGGDRGGDRRPFVAMTAALGLVLALALAITLISRDGPSAPGLSGTSETSSAVPEAGAGRSGQMGDEPSETEQLTSYPGIESHAAISADGEALAFSWDGEAGNAEIYWRALDEQSPIRLTRHPARDESPVFPPDGTRIAFVRHSTELCELRAVAIPAAIPDEPNQSTIESADRSVHLADCRQAGISPLAWWRDQLIFSDRDAADEPFRLQRLDLVSSEIAVLSSPPFGSFGDLYPAVSESGDRLAFLRATAQSTISTYLTPAIGDIFTADLPGATAEPVSEGDLRLRRLTFENQLVAGLTWLEGDTLVAYAAQTRDQGYGLWWVETDGAGVPRRWVSDPGGLLRLPARAGSRGIAYERWDGRTDIFQVFFDGSEQRRIQASTRSDLNPRWHPAGDRLAFTSARTGSYEIWTDRIALDGSELGAAVRRTSLEGAPTESPMWSPDGRLLTFEARSDGHSHLYLIDGEGNVRQLTSSIFDDRSPSFSADGRAIYFASNRSGSWQVWRLQLRFETDSSEPGRVTPGKATQVTRGGGFRALEGVVDGELALFFSKRDEGGLWRWHAETGEAFVAPLAPEHWGNWDLVAGRLFWVELGDDRTTRILSKHLSSGESATVATVPGWISRETPNLSIAPDGQSALITRFNGLAADILLGRIRD